MDRNIVLEKIIYPACKEIASSIENFSAIKFEENQALIGKEGVLDSLALVSLVVAIEQSISDQTNQSISLVSEKAMSRSESPFRSFGTLSDYVVELLAENKR